MSETKLHITAENTSKTPNKVGRLQKSGSNFFENWINQHARIKTKDLALFFRLLATMINAGLNIIKSLQILENQLENKHLKLITNDIRHRIESGLKLSEALQAHRTVFNEAQVGMILAGEASGNLNKVLLQAADQLEKSASISGKIKGALIYPVFIIVVIIVVGIAMMNAVIPKIAELFSSVNAELPFLTTVLIKTSNLLTSSTFGIHNTILLVLGIMGVLTAISAFIQTASGRLLWDSIMLKLPVFGNLNKKVALAKFCRNLSAMTASGISIIRALQITAGTVGNEVYRQRINLIAYDVKKGLTIADNIQADTQLFPPMVVNMIEVGEKTAKLHEVTSKVADFYEEEVDNLIQNLSKLMEPLIIVIIGIAAALMIFAIMQPIWQLSDVATQS